MKKFLSILLAMTLILGVVGASAEAVHPDPIEDNPASADG